MKRALKKGMLAAFVLTCTWVMAAFANEPTNNQNTYYVYVTTWGNGATTNQPQENGSYGVAYVTNVFSFTASYINKASVKIQFHEEFLSRYGNDKAHIYITAGVGSNIYWYKTYDEAASKRRKSIAEYADKNATIRHMNHFEFFPDK